ncbi:hypothetical protein ACTZWL_05775, partial [Klebsiella pneumoniae]
MAFDPPLGSTSPAVLLDNATRLDELVNGPAGTVNDRAGQPLDSWRLMLQTFAAVVENTRQNLIPLGKQYQSVEEAQADIASIPEGATTGTVAKLAMRQRFVLFKGLTFQKLCLPGAFRPGDHHN